MKISKKKFSTFITTVILFLLLVVIEKTGVVELDNTKEQDAYITSDKYGSYEVLRIVDGDTIVINYNGNKEKVRLIGVDTPESVHPDKNKNNEYGKLASEYTKKKLTGKYVGLELDVQERDKYGRILAYVYLDGEMYNKTLLKEGYAKVATYPPNVKYVEEFKKLEKVARENSKGLWGYEEE